MARRSRSRSTGQGGRPRGGGRGGRRPDPAELERRIALRQANVPTISYPEQLPVSQRRDEIAEAIRDHQVVIVAGETGSGKTTQLPKICLELGRGVQGMIGHTQPRRLAARTVADRIAEELGVELGGAVGYAVRFTDQVGDATLVKLMTDGILLAELQRDRLLSAYDTIIVDEAHERSLNIDFILGYLAQLLPRRPDLKVIITSATIETDRFSAHFGGAPIIEVIGPHLSGGGALPAARSSRIGRLARDRPWRPGERRRATRPDHRRSPTRCASCGARRRATCSCSCPASARSATPPTRCAALDLPDTEVLPLYARLVAGRAAPGVRAARGPAHRARHQRGRDVADRPRHPLRRRSSARPASRATAPDSRCSACRSSRCRRRRPTSGPGAAAGSPTASASASTPRTTSTPGPSSPTPRSCARTWPRSSCR